jgi:hypothetical protein
MTPRKRNMSEKIEQLEAVTKALQVRARHAGSPVVALHVAADPTCPQRSCGHDMRPRAMHPIAACYCVLTAAGGPRNRRRSARWCRRGWRRRTRSWPPVCPRAPRRTSRRRTCWSRCATVSLDASMARRPSGGCPPRAHLADRSAACPPDTAHGLRPPQALPIPLSPSLSDEGLAPKPPRPRGGGEARAAGRQ